MTSPYIGLSVLTRPVSLYGYGVFLYLEAKCQLYLHF
nr:MAG TPA: hypothetical protein [Caudoviricetes sp.]